MIIQQQTVIVMLPTLSRWTEVPFIQIWSTYFRGDYRPPIVINSERGTAEFGNDFLSTFEQFNDDNLRLTELLLAFERKKNDQLLKTIRLLERDNSTALQATNHLSLDFIHNQMKAEMTNNRLPEFCTYADKIYRDAWIDHYSDFHPNTPLLSNTAIIEIYQRIEVTFPMHHVCMKSMMYGKRSHEPQRANSKYNLEKRNIMVHYFFCFLRERDRHHLVHWALVTTIALHYRGIDGNSYRNGPGRACSLELYTAFEILDSIYNSTHLQQMNVLKSQRIFMSALDNYNRFQRFPTQRCKKSGVMHNGIVFSAVCAKEFNKPRGSILKNNKSELWEVLTSSLSSNYRTCIVTARLLTEPNSSELILTEIVATIELPSNDWKILLLPGLAPPVKIAHHDQDIPSSLRQKFPINVDARSAICADRLWMANIESDEQYRSIPVREYVNNVKIARMLNELWNAIMLPLFDESVTDTNAYVVLLQNSFKLFQNNFIDKIGGTDDSCTMLRNIKQF
jgi:hypothetical protein